MGIVVEVYNLNGKLLYSRSPEEVRRIFNLPPPSEFIIESGFYKDYYFQVLNMEKEKQVTDLGSKDGGLYDKNGNSSHYQSQFMEFVRDQERKYGTIVAALVCQSNVDKYNQRAGLKEGVPSSRDIMKRDWYLAAFKHFMIKINSVKKGEVAKGRNDYVFLAEEVFDLLRAELECDSPEYVPLSECIKK